MVKKYLSLALMGASAVMVTSCNAQNAGFKKTAKGLEYKIVKDDPSMLKPAIGDYMEFHIKSFLHLPKRQYVLHGLKGDSTVNFPEEDSLLFDSRMMNDNKPVPFNVAPPTFNGDLTEGFMMLTTGDSALFRMSVDSMAKAGGQPLPWMHLGTNQKIDYAVKVTAVKTQSQLQQEQREAAGKQIGVDEGLIKNYLAKNNVKATRTPSGLYYKMDKIGTGPKPKTGDSVSMNYTGMTLNGTKFDSNVDPKFSHVMPFWFKLGMHNVIQGWDEGIALMPKGSKGTLYIPSTLAYGQQSQGPLIPANSVLIFDVEVVDARASKAGATGK